MSQGTYISDGLIVTNLNQVCSGHYGNSFTGHTLVIMQVIEEDQLLNVLECGRL